MQLYMTRWFHIREEFNFGSYSKSWKRNYSIDVSQEEETINDVDKDDNNKETKNRNLDGLYGSNLCTFRC